MNADQAIEILENHLYAGKMPSKAHFEALALAVEALKRQRWIPCSERLPEKEGWYSVISYSQVQKRKYTTMKPFCEGAFRSLCEVSHWMPLPEPPEEGGSGNAFD